MTPTIQQEIELLENTKEDLALAIMEKGVVVQPYDLFSTYPTRISQITTTAGDKDELFKSIIDRSITSLTVPSGTTVLRPKLFTGCVNLTTLTLPEGLKTIKDGALSGAIAVTSLSIPDSVTTIEDCSSFHQTSSLTELTIGTGITYIGNMAFYGSPNLTSITITATTPPTLGSNNNAFNSTNNCPIYVPAASVDAYKAAWPTYASRIQAYVNAFSQIVQRTISGNYTIPSGITSIGDNVFYGCTGLTNVTLPSGITSIGVSAFYECSGLTSVTIPNSVLTISNNAFQRCSGLTSVTLPSSVVFVGSQAFEGCSNLHSVTCLATTPPTSGGSSMFRNAANDFVIYVPAESVSTYKSATGWSYYAIRIQAIPNS